MGREKWGRGRGKWGEDIEKTVATNVGREKWDDKSGARKVG